MLVRSYPACAAESHVSSRVPLSLTNWAGALDEVSLYDFGADVYSATNAVAPSNPSGPGMCLGRYMISTAR